ncbi:MAG: succinyldiaminopimelate transaminase [Gammaproteobacteria bacterium]|nr:succinyldiaminopimelate transaminase [Gammaproteobacteria bacterium]
MNPGLDELQPYPFERLAALRARVAPPPGRPLINLSIGEPQHPTPRCVHDALVAHLDATAKYPATRGLPELRTAITDWATRRFELPAGGLDAERHVLPVNGTREALFAITQAIYSRRPGKPRVAMPNPFYQIYEGAALLAGARPFFLPCPAERGFRPDFAAVPASAWQGIELVYVCSPGNPSGAVLNDDDYAVLIELADRHDFVVVADECYSELYLDESAPPLGLLQWCARHGRDDYARCMVMHSLSKRSNAPGLRSGFVAGDADLIASFLRYRTYQGGAMSVPVQHASIAAWRDEAHVRDNRAQYRAKFDAVLACLAPAIKVSAPAAGFYLWPELPVDGISACERLLGEAGVLTLPGAFLARDVDGYNPGARRLRIALVADLDECVEAAARIVPVLNNL